MVTRRLDRVAHARHLVLRGQAHLRAEHRVPLGDEDLRADEVDAGDDLGHGVFDLDARVHLDEEPVVPVEVVEELDGAGVVVADLLGDPCGGEAEFLADMVVESDARGDFHDLLVAALHGAVALVEVQDVAVLVAEDLHLDVLGARDVFLEEHCRVAEGAPGLGLGLIEEVVEVAGLQHDAHAAAAAAERGLDDQRKSDLAGGP